MSDPLRPRRVHQRLTRWSRLVRVLLGALTPNDAQHLRPPIRPSPSPLLGSWKRLPFRKRGVVLSKLLWRVGRFESRRIRPARLGFFERRVIGFATKRAGPLSDSRNEPAQL